MGVHILCCIFRNGVSYHSHMFLSWCSSKEASELDPHFWHLAKCPLLGSPQPVVGRGCTQYFLYWIIFPSHLSKRVKVLIIFLFFPSFLFLQQHFLGSSSRWRESRGFPFGWLHSRSDIARGPLAYCWPPVLVKVPQRKKFNRRCM